MSALRDQTEPVGILRELARATWPPAHDGAECPPERIPSPADLAAWLDDGCGDDARAKAIRRDEALGMLAMDRGGYVIGRDADMSVGMVLPSLFGIAAPGRHPDAAKVLQRVRAVHDRWIAYRSGAARMEGDDVLHWTVPPPGGWPKVRHPDRAPGGGLAGAPNPCSGGD